jgi:hypothetical protein
MANQMFSWAYGRLALPEMRHLLIDEPARMRSVLASRPSTQEELDRLEVLALLSRLTSEKDLQLWSRHCTDMMLGYFERHLRSEVGTRS